MKAQPPLEFLPPRLNPFVLKVSQLLLPSLMHWQTDITRTEAENVVALADLYRQFQTGKVRFLLAFRHPNPEDPYCLMYLLSRLLPQVAQQQGIALQPPFHAHFIYDRGIPLWAGKFVSWLYPRLGGTPIHRGKSDRQGLRSARNLFANGKLPLMASPEGATNGHNEIVSPLEPGIAQLGFWCVEDLLKAKRSEQVVILPVGIKYYYEKPPWQAIEQLLHQLEADVGIDSNVSANQELYPRLLQLAQQLLSVVEEFYQRFYPHDISTPSTTEAEIPAQVNQNLAARLSILLDTALKVSEEYFELQGKGNVIDRCRRLEQAAWDYIYREDLANESISPVEKGLANRIAAEANLRIWHMRMVEGFVAVTGKYVWEKPSAERFADTLLQMWDTVAKIKGGDHFHRPSLGKRVAKLTIGKPINVSDQWTSYRSQRRQAVLELTHEIQRGLEEMANSNG